MKIRESSRSEILSLLSEACELEHALACTYLFAAFSLKESAGSELTWEQQQRIRLWAAQVYFVASQEMLHLAQVWNILTALGGTPYYGRPAFPLDRDYFPIDAPLVLARYSKATLERFLRWEQPFEYRATRSFRGTSAQRTVSAVYEHPYQTVGELYKRIEDLIVKGDQQRLFIGRPEHQVGRDIADFPDLIPVFTPDDAVRAIRAIRAQGEGSEQDRDDCHFGVFHDLRVALENAAFDPAREVVDNPVRRGPGTVITEARTRAIMELFDDIYILMLRMLAWAFGPVDTSIPAVRGVARTAIRLMTVVMKPLGEAITMFPSGDGQRAGPAFTLGRHVPLPVEVPVATQLIREHLDELCARADELLTSNSELARVTPKLAELLRTARDALG